MTKRIILLIITTLATFSFSNAQEKPTSEKKFFNTRSTGYFNNDHQTSRVVTETEFLKKDGTVERSITETVETIPGSEESYPKTHILKVEKEKAYDYKYTTEMIEVDSKIYVRVNNGSWSTKVSEIGSGSGDFNGGLKQYTEEKTSINEAPALKLKVLEVYPAEDVFWKPLRFQTITIWYDESGQFMRKEHVKGFLEPKVEEWREVTTYEYGMTDLKIEAPIK